MGGSPTFEFSQKGSTSTLDILIHPSSLIAMLNNLFPPMVGTHQPLGLSHPDASYLYPETVSVSPFPKDLTHGHGPPDAQAPKLRCKIKYKTTERNDDDEPGTLVTHTIDVGGDFLTLPGHGLKWKGESQAVQEEDIQAGKIVPQMEHQLSWDDVSTVPYSAIRNCIGCVNNSSFFGAARETMLFCGANIERSVLTDGTASYKIDYKLSERVLRQGSTSVGWNHFYRPGTGNWEKLQTLNTNELIYTQVNLQSLFS